MRVRLAVVVLTALFACAIDVDAQTPARIRGTITAIDDHTLSVKERDGRDLKLKLPENLAVAVAKAARFEDIKQGDYLGATTSPGPDGNPVAVELHYLPTTVPEGQGPWDLRPGTTMTNASVQSVVTDVGKREITLKYKGTTQTVLVPEGTPIARSAPGTRADLVPGEYIFTVAQVASDGSMTAGRIQVSKDGVKPPL
ncbi:MAG TPA: hypothetical protein VFC24_18715 [Casimicrobiaceae bacterium]|nr:hypothetical protein [Casimicrobiaceae bacterium]